MLDKDIPRQYKLLFFRAMRKGFYFKDRDDNILFAEPNTFNLHYFLLNDLTLQCGFSVNIATGMYFFYLGDYDYKKRWSLNKKDLLCQK